MAMAKKECPDSVKLAGARWVKARRTARVLAGEIDDALKATKRAGKEMKEEHGMRIMELGIAFREGRLAQAAEGHVAAGHNSLREMLGKCGVEEPTDDDIIVILGGGGGGGR